MVSAEMKAGIEVLDASAFEFIKVNQLFDLGQKVFVTGRECFLAYPLHYCDALDWSLTDLTQRDVVARWYFRRQLQSGNYVFRETAQRIGCLGWAFRPVLTS